jgi:transposase
LPVCGNKRIERNRVFAGCAKRGKTTMGWFFGFKLHLVINECGELLAATMTPGNVDDRKPVPSLVRRLIGKLFGDKGYISASLFQELWDHGLQLITSVRSNMKNRLMPWMDKIMLRKRSLIETVNDQLKNITQVEHTRHRSVLNFMVNLVAGLICYTHQPKKPTLRIPESSDFFWAIDWTSGSDGQRKRKSSLKPYNQGMCGSMCSFSRRWGRPS